jgi:hypothetical protein
LSDKKEKSGALPGAQEKYLATLAPNGRYVVNDNINLDPIPSRPVGLRDKAALDEALKAPAVQGPPSIVDQIIEGRKKQYVEECRSRQHAIDSANASVSLSKLSVTDEMRSLQQRYVRGELTIDEVIAEILRHHNATIERNKKVAHFDKSELLSAEDICKRLEISPVEFEAAVLESDLYFVWGEDDVLRYSGASANKISRVVKKDKP